MDTEKINENRLTYEVWSGRYPDTGEEALRIPPLSWTAAPEKEEQHYIPGILCLILSCVSLLLFYVGFDFAIGIAAIIFGLVQYSRRQHRGIAVFGIALALVSLVLCTLALLF